MILPVDDAARETALLRGTLDLCVLALLHEPTHAYDVVNRLQQAGFGSVSYGTIYPLTTRLRRQGLLAQHSEASSTGPNRNVLRLTDSGTEAVEAWEKQWREHSQRVDDVLTGTRPRPEDEMEQI